MAGRWYGQRLMGGGITSAVEGGNANRMVFVPFTVPRTHTYTGIGLQCTTLDTGKYVRLAIYKDNGTPGNKELMYQTSELSLNGVGDKSETGLTIELPAGAYWLAYVQNGVAQFQAAEQADVIQNLGFANVNDLNSGVCVHYGYTYAAFPATSDAYALASPQTSANTPLIRVQA